MKIRFSVFGLALVVGLAIAGCVTLPTAEQATIARHVDRPAVAVEAAVRKTALARGFTEKERNIYEQAASYPVDPILGLVKTSDKPNTILRFTLELQENASGTLLKTAPVTVGVDGKYAPFYWRPGTKANAEVAALLDAALAEAQFAKSP